MIHSNTETLVKITFALVNSTDLTCKDAHLHKVPPLIEHSQAKPWGQEDCLLDRILLTHRSEEAYEINETKMELFLTSCIMFRGVQSLYQGTCIEVHSTCISLASLMKYRCTLNNQNIIRKLIHFRNYIQKQNSYFVESWNRLISVGFFSLNFNY